VVRRKVDIAVSILGGMPELARKSADAYWSLFWLLSRITSTFIPRLWASRRALAILYEVNE